MASIEAGRYRISIGNKFHISKERGVEVGKSYLCDIIEIWFDISDRGRGSLFEYNLLHLIIFRAHNYYKVEGGVGETVITLFNRIIWDGNLIWRRLYG